MAGARFRRSASSATVCATCAASVSPPRCESRRGMEARRAATTGGAASYVRISVTYVASRNPRRGVVRPVRRAEARGQQRRRREDSAHPLGELAPPAAVCEGEGRPGGEGGRLRRPQLARRLPDEDSAA